MNGFFLAGVGGALGAMARYGVGLAAARWIGPEWPVATLAVNVIGGFAMGLLVGFVPADARAAQVFLGVGVLGGFTTFSAFSLDLLRMLERGEVLPAFAYGLTSVVAAAAACYAGLILARSFS